MKNRFAFLLIFPVSLFLFSCKKNVIAPQSELVLGTVCTINLYEDGTEALYGKLFARLRKINGIFDVHSADSELSKVNAKAFSETVSVSPELFFVMKTALEACEKTDGFFNPVLGPLIELWNITGDAPHVPTEEELKALPSMDVKNVVLSGNESGGTVHFLEKGMAFDLGGIAKGFAADELVKVLREEKVRSAMIYLGGNVFVYGKKKDNSLWKVGIRDPENPDNAALLIQTEEATVVTSGDYERFFVKDGVRYHHILNPYTGFPSESEASSVTIVSRSSILSDVLSTYIFIVGKEGIGKTEDTDFFGHFECIVMERNGKVYGTHGLNGKIRSLDQRRIDLDL